MAKRPLRDILKGYTAAEKRLHELNEELSAWLADEPPVVEPPVNEVVRPVSWDPQLSQRGVLWMHGASPWRYNLIRGVYLNVDAAQGRHHILVDVLDDQGHRKVGAAVRVAWQGGDWQGVAKPKPGEPWALAFPMYASGNAYSLEFGGWTISGMGLGTIEQPNVGHHVSYGFVFRERGAAG